MVNQAPISGPFIDRDGGVRVRAVLGLDGENGPGPLGVRLPLLLFSLVLQEVVVC